MLFVKHVPLTRRSSLLLHEAKGKRPGKPAFFPKNKRIPEEKDPRPSSSDGWDLFLRVFL